SGSMAMFSLLCLLGCIFVWMIAALVVPLYITWFTWIMKQKIDGVSITSNEAWRFAWKRYVPVTWVLVLQGLIVLAWLLPWLVSAYLFVIYKLWKHVELTTILIDEIFFLPLVIPPIMLQVWYTFAVYVASALPINGKAALTYSRELVRG